MDWKELYQMIPLQVRTFGETVTGDTSPITQQNLSEADIDRLQDVIAASRSYKQGLIDQFYGQDNPDMDNYAYNQYKKAFPNEEAVQYFKSGGGNVSYDDYYNARQGGRGDLDISPSASIMNTLGQFSYSTADNHEKTLNIADSYDFYNDYNAQVMPREVANTARYEGLDNLDKLKLLAKETWQMPGRQADMKTGIQSLPSRLGNAFVGKDNARPVNIQFTPNRDLNPSEMQRNAIKEVILQQILGNY